METFKCKKCKLGFKTTEKLQKHKYLVHTETVKVTFDDDYFELSRKEGKLWCPRCPTKFAKPDTLSRHITKRHEERFKLVACKSKKKRPIEVEVPDPIYPPAPPLRTRKRCVEIPDYGTCVLNAIDRLRERDREKLLLDCLNGYLKPLVQITEDEQLFHIVRKGVFNDMNGRQSIGLGLWTAPISTYSVVEFEEDIIDDE